MAPAPTSRHFGRALRCLTKVLKTMAERQNELKVEKESSALKKLQALSGIAEKGTTERLDWMYEQSVAQKTDMELMNAPVSSGADKDLEDVKALQASTAGSLFLKGPATRTTEDMLRKLREDPLFQIRREEQAARESMLQNPLIQARLRHKQEKASKKHSKKDMKKAKKAAKKEKKAMKKAKKAMKKHGKKGGSSSSSSSSSGSAEAPAAARPPAAVAHPGLGSGRGRDRSRSGGRRPTRVENLGAEELKSLGPNMDFVKTREDRAATIAERKKQAIESRGAPKRMDEDEKRRRLEQMSADAKTHDATKSKRISAAEVKDGAQDELETKQRATSDQKYFREMRQQTYMEENGSMADKIKNQKGRRQKGIIDDLEKDD